MTAKVTFFATGFTYFFISLTSLPNVATQGFPLRGHIEGGEWTIGFREDQHKATAMANPLAPAFNSDDLYLHGREPNSVPPRQVNRVKHGSPAPSSPV